MKAILSSRRSASLPLQVASIAFRSNGSPSRFVHSSPLKAAIAHPITAHGPPPKAPSPAPEFTNADHKRTEDVPSVEQPESTQSKPSKVLQKRFWKDVDVTKKPGTYLNLLTTFSTCCLGPSFPLPRLFANCYTRFRRSISSLVG